MKGQTLRGERPEVGLGPEPYVLLGVGSWKMESLGRGCVCRDLALNWLRRAAWDDRRVLWSGMVLGFWRRLVRKISSMRFGYLRL